MILRSAASVSTDLAKGAFNLGEQPGEEKGQAQDQVATVPRVWRKRAK